MVSPVCVCFICIVQRTHNKVYITFLQITKDKEFLYLEENSGNKTLLPERFT